MNGDDLLIRSASQGVIVSVDGNFIETIAQRACELQGLPIGGWQKLSPEHRRGLERGTAHVLRAMQSLGWKFVPPERP